MEDKNTDLAQTFSALDTLDLTGVDSEREQLFGKLLDAIFTDQELVEFGEMKDSLHGNDLRYLQATNMLNLIDKLAEAIIIKKRLGLLADKMDELFNEKQLANLQKRLTEDGIFKEGPSRVRK